MVLLSRSRRCGRALRACVPGPAPPSAGVTSGEPSRTMHPAFDLSSGEHGPGHRLQPRHRSRPSPGASRRPAARWSSTAATPPPRRAAERQCAPASGPHGRGFDVTDPAAVGRRGDRGCRGTGRTARHPGQQRGHATARPAPGVHRRDWHRLLDTNLTSAFLVGREAARRMMERGHGKIVNICSLQSEVVRPGIAPYAATKGALKMLTKGMCADGPTGSGQRAGPGLYRDRTDRRSSRTRSSAPGCAAAPRPAAGAVPGTWSAGALPRLARRGLRQRPVLYVDGGVLAVL